MTEIDDIHWSELLIKFLTRLSEESGVTLVGADEGFPDGDDYPSQVTIGHLRGRWWLIIEDEESPVFCTTDGTVENTHFIYIHEDGMPFLEAISDSFKRLKHRGAEEAQ